jgi:hypothetical protein
VRRWQAAARRLFTRVYGCGLPGYRVHTYTSSALTHSLLTLHVPPLTSSALTSQRTLDGCRFNVIADMSSDESEQGSSAKKRGLRVVRACDVCRRKKRESNCIRLDNFESKMSQADASILMSNVVFAADTGSRPR